MTYVTVNGQKITTGQYVLAKSIFSFSSGSPPLRPAKVEYFFKHTIFVNECDSIVNFFATVSWPMCHPFQHHIGKPYEIWCVNAYETCNKNCFLPVHYFNTVLLTACHVIRNQSVLVTVPLVM